MGRNLMVIILFFFASSANAVIFRHDKNDAEFLALAEDLAVSKVIIRFNSTDVAGTLIAPDWLLSAAHVAELIKPGQTLFHGNTEVTVKNVIIHPGWLENGRPEDVALIRLEKPIVEVEPMQVYTGASELGMEVYVAGNGDTGTGLTGPVPELQDGRFRAGTNRVDRVTVDYLVWSFENPSEDPEEPTAMEAISGPGDSGGPAFVECDGVFFILGISSAQSTRDTGGREGLYGVVEYYTRVSRYANWIEANLKQK